MKRYLTILLAMLLVLCLNAPALGESTGGKGGFDTPEACAEAVVHALISGDADAFLDCFAIAEWARGFDLGRNTERINALVLGNTLYQPDDAFAIAYNESRLTQELLERVIASSLKLTNAEFDTVWGRAVRTKQYSAEECLKMADDGGTAEKLIYKTMIMPETLHSRYTEAIKKNPFYVVFGADTWVERVLALDYEGRTVYMALGFVQYAGGWLAAPYTTVIGAIMGAPSYLLYIAEDAL